MFSANTIYQYYMNGMLAIGLGKCQKWRSKQCDANFEIINWNVWTGIPTSDVFVIRIHSSVFTTVSSKLIMRDFRGKKIILFTLYRFQWSIFHILLYSVSWFNVGSSIVNGAWAVRTGCCKCHAVLRIRDSNAPAHKPNQFPRNNDCRLLNTFERNSTRCSSNLPHHLQHLQNG